MNTKRDDVGRDLGYPFYEVSYVMQDMSYIRQGDREFWKLIQIWWRRWREAGGTCLPPDPGCVPVGDGVFPSHSWHLFLCLQGATSCRLTG